MAMCIGAHYSMLEKAIKNFVRSWKDAGEKVPPPNKVLEVEQYMQQRKEVELVLHFFALCM